MLREKDSEGLYHRTHDALSDSVGRFNTWIHESPSADRHERGFGEAQRDNPSAGNYRNLQTEACKQVLRFSSAF